MMINSDNNTVVARGNRLYIIIRIESGGGGG
jgi:hypothetical protein